QPLFGSQGTRSVEDKLGEHIILEYFSEGSVSGVGNDLWQPAQIAGGRPFNPPKPLVKKLDHSIVEEERARLGQKAA
ncbi:MAG: hypothetical protein GYA81_07590, partial [Chloroflexi bacterium]|nr:hypothetical protein [Chloroflexota bacterium]